ncbi:hypothetical protein B0H16DRAFT_1723052 [Mycena metata]|uniref:Uncharacterized protein n=1 Tax=Mycena metata TaxID=1033252 RepID=A0AAD7IZI0_9AGAR|nr:hypothetical protein B0H16DRAFT_1723052 [Mycena metata]
MSPGPSSKLKKTSQNPSGEYDPPLLWPHVVKPQLVTANGWSPGFLLPFPTTTGPLAPQEHRGGKGKDAGEDGERVSADEKSAEEFRARARAASRTYREKHAGALAHRQQMIRIEVYGRKHGHHAWLERHQQLETRRAEAQERADWARYEAEYQEKLKAPQGGRNTA